MIKTAVIYARYSSDNQTEQSIEGQLRVCQKYAENNNILILNTYIDRAMTGTNDNRPDFQKMIKDSENKDFQYVLVYKLDRFSRNRYETAIHKHTLQQNGVKILSATENIPDTPEGIIFESLIEGMNQYYSVELSQKVKRGMKETRIKGNFQGGYLLYGYKLENKKILIDEEQAEIVRYIYKQYALGKFVKDILDDLNEKHVLHRNKPFSRTTIYNILSNEKYTGVYRFGDEIYYNTFPAIISHDIFEQIRDKTKINKKGSRSTKSRYMFRNKMICGYCGRPISAETGTSHNGVMKRYYKCLGRKHHNGCTKDNVRKEEFEEFVVNSILETLKKPDSMQIIVKNLLETQSKIGDENVILNHLLKEKRESEKNLNNIMQAVEQGLINNTTIKRMQELETKIAELEKDILIEQNKSISKISEEEIKEFYIKALNLEPQTLINYIVKEIKAYNDKLEITFNTPIKTSPDNQGSSFLSILKQLNHLCFGRTTQNIINIKLEMCI